MQFFIKENYFEFYPENVKIKYLNECIMESFEMLPRAFFGEAPFKKIYYSRESVKIAIDEWLPFHSKLVRMFNGDEMLINMFQNQMKVYLNTYEYAINKLYISFIKRHTPETEELNNAFEYYKLVNGYATLNFIMPKKIVKDFFEANDIMLENIMCSLILPHRFQYRKKELSLAALNNLTEHQAEIKSYLQHEYIYTKEFEWNLYAPYMDSETFVRRKIESIRNSLTKNDIYNELNAIELGRKRKMRELNELLRKLFERQKISEENKKLFNLTTLVINVATQEEWRHMTTSKFMYVLGKIGYEKGIDMARMNEDKIRKYIVV